MVRTRRGSHVSQVATVPARHSAPMNEAPRTRDTRTIGTVVPCRMPVKPVSSNEVSARKKTTKPAVTMPSAATAANNHNNRRAKNRRSSTPIRTFTTGSPASVPP